MHGVIVCKTVVYEAGVEMWVEPEHVPVQIIKPLSYGTEPGLKREVPGTRFYHILAWKSEHFKNSIFVPHLPPCFKDLFCQYKGMDHILFNSLLL